MSMSIEFIANSYTLARKQNVFAAKVRLNVTEFANEKLNTIVRE
jgi:hypothetical protein